MHGHWLQYCTTIQEAICAVGNSRLVPHNERGKVSGIYFILMADLIANRGSFERKAGTKSLTSGRICRTLLGHVECKARRSAAGGAVIAGGGAVIATRLPPPASGSS